MLDVYCSREIGGGMLSWMVDAQEGLELVGGDVRFCRGGNPLNVNRAQG